MFKTFKHFVCTTVGEYLSFLILRSWKSIPFIPLLIWDLTYSGVIILKIFLQFQPLIKHNDWDMDLITTLVKCVIFTKKETCTVINSECVTLSFWFEQRFTAALIIPVYWTCPSVYGLCAGVLLPPGSRLSGAVIHQRSTSDIKFFVNASVSSLSADWKIWEALFICMLLTPPSCSNGTGCVQAINATTNAKSGDLSYTSDT